MIFQSKLKCYNYPALIERRTYREINDPQAAKKCSCILVYQQSIYLLCYVLSNRGFLFAPVSLSKVQLVSWPLQAVKASSFNSNRWHAQSTKPLSYFYPMCIKTNAELSLQPLSRWDFGVLRHCTSLTIHLPFAWLEGDCFGSILGRRILSNRNEYRSQSLESGLRWQQASSTALRDSPASFWKWPDLSTEEEPCSARATWQAEDTSFQSCLPHPWPCVARRGGKN